MNKHSYSIIMLKHVAYKTYFDVTESDFESVFLNFNKLLERKGLIAKSPLHFAVTQVDLHKNSNIEVFIAVNKSFESCEELQYRTYFYIKNLLQGRITSNNFVKDEIELLNEMQTFAKENNLTFISPYYHIFKTNYKNEKAWVEVKAKVYENE